MMTLKFDVFGVVTVISQSQNSVFIEINDSLNKDWVRAWVYPKKGRSGEYEVSLEAFYPSDANMDYDLDISLLGSHSLGEFILIIMSDANKGRSRNYQKLFFQEELQMINHMINHCIKF